MSSVALMIYGDSNPIAIGSGRDALTEEKYNDLAVAFSSQRFNVALCEINGSSVSPFPPSSIKFIIDEVGNRIK